MTPDQLATKSDLAALTAEVRAMAASLRHDRPAALNIVRRRGPVTMLRFEWILNNPHRAADVLAEAVRPLGKLNIDVARFQVIRRSAQCAPGLDIEAAATPLSAASRRDAPAGQRAPAQRGR